MKQVKTKSLSHKHFPTFSYQLPKIYLDFTSKKTLMKPDTFDFTPTPAFLLQLCPSTTLSFLLSRF